MACRVLTQDIKSHDREVAAEKVLCWFRDVGKAIRPTYWVGLRAEGRNLREKGLKPRTIQSVVRRRGKHLKTEYEISRKHDDALRSFAWKRPLSNALAHINPFIFLYAKTRKTNENFLK